MKTALEFVQRRPINIMLAIIGFIAGYLSYGYLF